MSFKDYPSVEYVKSIFRYENGRLIWLQRPLEHFVDEHAWKIWNIKHAGKEAGAYGGFTDSENVRCIIGIAGKRIRRYTIVWAIHKGYWPRELDHINHDPSDDRIENLREATQSQNRWNSSKRCDNTSGFKGVSWDKDREKWSAKIRVNGKNKCIGRFNTPEEAHAAYMRVAKEHWGEFAFEG